MKQKILYLIIIFVFFLSPILLSQDIFLEERNIKNFVISPDSKLIAYIHYEPGWGGYINIYDIEKKTIIKKIESKTVDIGSCLSFSPDFKFLAWNNYDGISVYELGRDKTQFLKIKCRDFIFSPINNLIVITDGDLRSENISLIDIKSKQVIKNINNSFSEWNGLLSTDGNIITTSREGKLYSSSFFPDQNSIPLSVKSGDQYINCYATSYDYSYFACFGNKFNVGRFSDLTINTYVLQKDVSNVISATFSPLDQNIIYGTYNAYKIPNYQIFFSDLNGNTVESMLSENPKKLNFTSNGKYLVCLEEYGIKFIDAKKYLSYLKFYTKHYELHFNDYQNELAEVFERSKTRGEFETPEEYELRLSSAFALKKSIDEKYYGLFANLVANDIEQIKQKYNENNSQIQKKIDQSIEVTETKIHSVGTYNIEKELLPVTINGITENVKIKRDDAKSLKENFSKAIVKGKKRLKYDLKNYEYFELIIIHPTSFVEYKFGN